MIHRILCVIGIGLLAACGGSSESDGSAGPDAASSPRPDYTPAAGIPTPPFGEIAVGNMLEDLSQGQITPINNYTWLPTRVRSLQFVMRPQDLGLYAEQFGTPVHGETVGPPDPAQSDDELLLMFKMYWWEQTPYVGTPGFEARVYMKGSFCGKDGWFLRALPVGDSPHLWAGGMVVGWPKFNLSAEVDETDQSLYVRGYFLDGSELFELRWSEDPNSYSRLQDPELAYWMAPGRFENETWWWYSPIHLIGPDVRETFGYPDAMAPGNASARNGVVQMRLAHDISPELTLGSWPKLFPAEFSVPASIIDLESWGWTEYSGNCGTGGLSVIQPPS